VSFDEIRKEIAKEISEKLNVDYDDVINLVQKSKVETADVESRVAFRFSKQLNKNPIEIAKELKNKMNTEKWEIENVKGYLNFKFKDEFYVELLKTESEIKKKYEKVIIEYPSVNPNKPLHIGHLRCAVLGDSVSKLLEKAGYETVKMNYIDDLGLQIAQIAWYINKMKIEPGNKKYDLWLGEEYVNASKVAEENKEEIEKLMHSMEKGEAREVREICEKCVLAQHETLHKLNIYHNVLVWESEIVQNKLLDEAMNELENKGILVDGEGKYEGCKVVKLSENEKFKNLLDADKVFIRANGVATYTAKDIAFQMWKFGIIRSEIKFQKMYNQMNGEKLYTSSPKGQLMKFNNSDKIINVIGMEQKYPQEVIKTTLEMADYEQAGNYVHLSYGHAKLEDVKFSGRKGTWIGYTVDEVLNESVSRAYDLINEKFKDYSQEEKEKISNAVGIGALRYSFIKINPEREIVFEWDKALNFDGDSGPYLQYAYARALHIIQKTNERSNDDYIITNEHEKKLIKKLKEFEDVISNSAEDVAPNKIAEYALDLCSIFNSFYANCHVVNEKNKKIKNTRKKIIELFINNLGVCLDVIGVPKIDRM
jgi:arginyl-tRNA synthetase